MKGVAIVDLSYPPIPGSPDLAERGRRRVYLDDLAALDPDGAGEQLESLAHHFAVGSAGSFRHLKSDAVRVDAQSRAFQHGRHAAGKTVSEQNRATEYLRPPAFRRGEQLDG